MAPLPHPLCAERISLFSVPGSESLGTIGLNEVTQAEGHGEQIFWMERNSMGSTGTGRPKCVFLWYLGSLLSVSVWSRDEN